MIWSAICYVSGMSPAGNIGEFGAIETRPSSVGEGSPFAIRVSSASQGESTPASPTTGGDSFRQGWKAIVDEVHSAEIPIGDAAPVGMLLNEAGESAAGKNLMERAAGGAQKARAAAQLSVTARFPATHALPDCSAPGAVADPDTRSGKGPAQDGGFEKFRAKASPLKPVVPFEASSHKSKMAPEKQNEAASDPKVFVPDSQVVIFPMQLSQFDSGVRPGQEPQPKVSTPELLNLQVQAPRGSVEGLPGPDTPQPFAGREANIQSPELDRTSESGAEENPSSQQPSVEQPSPGQGNPSVFGFPASHTSGSVQAEPAMQNEQSHRIRFEHGSRDVSASGSPAQPGVATGDSDFSPGTEKRPNLPGTTRKDVLARDQAGMHEAQIVSPPATADASVLHRALDADSNFPGLSREDPGGTFAAQAVTRSSLGGAGHAGGRQVSGAHEPFAAMDSVDNGGAPRWILAGSHKAEAGFQDPSLGWISVRAQSGAGGIHASVVAPSDVAAQVLGGQLEGLNAHLAGHFEQLKTVTLSTADTGPDGRDAGGGMLQGNGRDSGDGGQSQGKENSGSAALPKLTQDQAQRPSEERTPVADLAAVYGGMNPSTHHFSAMA
jgi:hypothetical protein